MSPASECYNSERRTYQPGEDILITKLYNQKYTHKDIAQRVGRTTQAISHRIQKLGLSRKKTHKQWQESELVLLKKLRKDNVVSITEMANILKRTFPSVGSMIRILGI